MFRYKIFFSLKLFLLLLSFTSSTQASLQSEIKSMLDKYGTKSSFSLRGADGSELISVRGDIELAPASIAKTVSTGCSLLTLGPSYQFATDFGFTGKISGDKLTGNLVIRGEGDPGLVSEDLKEAIEKIRTLYQIKSIEGELEFDVSYMGQESLVMSNGFEGDDGRSFAASLTPIPMNQNSFSIWASPSYRGDNKTAAATFPAEVLDVQLSNTTKIGKTNSIFVQYDPDKKKASVSGAVDPEEGPKGIWRSVPDNYEYYSKLIHKLWIQSGGQWSSMSYRVSKTPVKSTLLWKNLSRPIAKQIMDINKFSLNMGAELLLLASGAKVHGMPANYDKALIVLEQCLKDFKIAKNGIQLANASGLSREARIRTSSLTDFLNQMSSSIYAPEYLSSLSLLGIDGTGKARLKNYQGRGRIKTGSIAGVSSIAGFLYGPQRESYSFALIMNGVSASESGVKQTQDAILKKILDAKTSIRRVDQ